MIPLKHCYNINIVQFTMTSSAESSIPKTIQVRISDRFNLTTFNAMEKSFHCSKSKETETDRLFSLYL